MKMKEMKVEIRNNPLKKKCLIVRSQSRMIINYEDNPRLQWQIIQLQNSFCVMEAQQTLYDRILIVLFL